MRHVHWSSSALTACLLLLAGTPPTSTVTAARSARAFPAASSPCQWTAQLPEGMSTGSAPVPRSGTSSAGVTYAALPDEANRVLVDQPTGTIFALSGADPTGTSGLLTVLQGATHRPPAWFPTKAPSGDSQQYLVGVVIPLADGHGQMYFSCGSGLYQLAPDGQPQPAAVPSLTVLPLFVTPAAVDEPAHRLFSTAQGLRGYDLRTGAELFRTADQPTSLTFGALAVDAQGSRVYALGTIPSLTVQPGPTDLYVFTLQGKLLRKLPGFGAEEGVVTQLALAGTTRRLVLFGCTSANVQLAQVLNLTTGRYLTPSPLRLGACGTGYPSSLLHDKSPVVTVDAAAGTGIVVGYNSADLFPNGGPVISYPGYAWLINLRTGQLLQPDTTAGCVQVGRDPVSVAIDSRLHRAYVASSGDGLVTILDTRTGQVQGVVHVGSEPVSIAVDTHDNEVVVGLDGVVPWDGGPNPHPTWGGVAFFPADLHQATVPQTLPCA